MRREVFVRPIPASVRDTLSMELDSVEDTRIRYKVRRLVEAAYGEGYDDGHLSGTRETSEDTRAETSKLRDQLTRVQDQLTATVDNVASAIREGRDITVTDEGSLFIADTVAPRP